MLKQFFCSSTFPRILCAFLLPFLFLIIPPSATLWILLFPLPIVLAWWGGAMAGVINTVSCLTVLILLSPGWVAGVICTLSGLVVSLMVFRLQQSEEEKVEQLKLERNQRFLDSLLENIPNMVFVKEAKELRLVRINKAGEELLGHKREDVIGKNDFDFFPPEQARFFSDNDRKVLAGNEILDIPEETLRTKNRGDRILHTKKIPIFSPEGEVEYVLGISEDITELKKKEAELLKITAQEGALKEREKINKIGAFLGEASSLLSSSLDYKQTLEQLTKICIPLLGDWCVISLRVNNHFERFSSNHTNPSLKSLLDEALASYPIEEGNPNLEVMDSGKSIFLPHPTEEDFKKFAKDERHLEIIKQIQLNSLIIVPISRRNKTIGSISFICSGERNFSKDDLYIAEELGRRAGVAIDNAILYATAQASIDMRDEFLSIASHELKTPLTSLNLQLQMALRDLKKEQWDKKRINHLMNLSVKQIERLNSLINGLLDVSRISTGTLTINPEPVNFEVLIKDVVERFNDQLKQAKNTVNFDLEPGLSGEWDVLRFEQVVVNLLGNIIKYAPGTAVDISLYKQNNLINVAIRDHGPGIPLDKQPVVFDRFERLGKDKTIAGLGLGLYIVKQIVEAHKGRIFVDPRVTDGTKIFFYFPAKISSKS